MTMGCQRLKSRKKEISPRQINLHSDHPIHEIKCLTFVFVDRRSVAFASMSPFPFIKITSIEVRATEHNNNLIIIIIII